MFHSVGLATVVLPYYSRYKKWGHLMRSLCKTFNNLWSKYFEAFRILSKMTPWPTDVKMINYIISKVKQEGRKEFDKSSTLKIV